MIRFPFLEGVDKTPSQVHPYLECGMCGRANDNLCDDCETCLHPQECVMVEHLPPESKRQWIGSGEDGNLYMDYHGQ